jgi:gliding motility-associated-like protein
VVGVTYSWSGPGGFTSVLQNPSISPSAVNESGIYTVTATYLGCVSDPATTEAVVHPIPDITAISFVNPQTCHGVDGIITLTGLTTGVSYTVTYSFNGVPASATATADASGNVVIDGLPSGTYSDVNVSSFTCLSNTMGPVTLTDPQPPYPPTLGSNSPVCSGKTLILTSSDPVSPLVYDWSGPNGFTSGEQNPQIPNVSLADSGVYTLVIKHLNCPASATEYVVVRPPVVLTDVTPSQVIPFGSSKQLMAEGAEFYLWWPADGSLSNPNIKNPVATPQDSTTYILEGINEWGCVDSAVVSLGIDFDIEEGVPNAFSPNNDGRNDIFRLVNAKYDKLIDFSVFNRWGQMVYHNESDITQGWNGTFNGVLQTTGTYFYHIIVATPEGENKEFKGDVTLIR